MVTEAPVAEPSLLNEITKEVTPEKTQEQMLFPDPETPEKKADEPAKPDEPAAKADDPKPGEPDVKKEEPKPGEPKPSADAKPAPVDYENLKLPEGSPLPVSQLEAFKKQAKEQGLTLEEAQGVLDVKNDAAKAVLEFQKQSLETLRQTWRDNWLKDPVYGGEKAAESTELAKRGWNWLANNELKTLADQTGFGDHPAVLAAMARLGKLFAEDSNIRGSTGAVARKRAPEEVLYGATTSAPDEPMS